MGSKKIADVYQKTGEIHKKSSGWGVVVVVIVGILILGAIM